MEVSNLPTSVGIFIFYHKPTNEYISTLRSFMDVSLGLNKFIIYSLSDYSKYGLYDIMEDILIQIKKLNRTKFHYIMVYLENTLITDTTIHKELFWYRLFDVFVTNHVIILYKDVIDFELPIFKFEVVPSEKEISVYQHSIEFGLINRYLIIDNYNLEELCNNILNVVDEMDIYQFLIERRYDITRSTLYCNFTPSNLVNLFYNYKFKNLAKICENDIIPIYVSTIGIRILNILYNELKNCQKKRLITHT